jgi:hypothetical protein
MIRGCDERSRRFHGDCDDLRQCHPLKPKLDLVRRDARYIQKIVDEPDHVPELTSHHSTCVFESDWIVWRQFEHLDPTQERGQRISQLVSEQGQELILLPIRARELGREVALGFFG